MIEISVINTGINENIKMLPGNHSINLSKSNTFLSDSIRYRNNKGEISLLKPCYATMGTFEIYCITGDLFNDIERYNNIDDAEARIFELLQDDEVKYITV